MTRAEYIRVLTERMKGIDGDSLRDIILEIEDHIDGLAREHPEKSPEEVVGMLEPPESLGDSLREAAGLEPFVEEERHWADREDAEDEREDSSNREDRGKSDTTGFGKNRVRITIDDEEFQEAIRKAFDIAKLFSRRRGDKRDESLGDMFAKAFDLKNVKLSDVRRATLRTRSSDVEVLFSNDQFSMATPGEDTPHMQIEYSSGGELKISVPLGVSEPDRIELRVPASVDELKISTVSGDVHVLDRVGPLALTTASGDMRVDACDGDLEANSASGDILLSECRGDVKVSTASGDIDIGVDELCNSIQASSASGDISLRYPDSWDATVSFTTVSGDVDHDAAHVGRGSIRIGSGLAPVRVSTVSGDIRIHRA